MYNLCYIYLEPFDDPCFFLVREALGKKHHICLLSGFHHVEFHHWSNGATTFEALGLQPVSDGQSYPSGIRWRTPKPVECFHGNQNGGFLKWWYPQIIHFNRVFHYKPSILGYPYFWKHLNTTAMLGGQVIDEGHPKVINWRIMTAFRGYI